MKQTHLFEAWLDEQRHRLAVWVLGLTSDYTLVPVHEADLPGNWVACHEDAYQALIPFGYPYPEGTEAEVEV